MGLNLDQLRHQRSELHPTARKAPLRPRAGEKFLRGPIPLGWLTTAARLPGKALHVSVAAWFQAGMRGPDGIRLSKKLLATFGVDRYSAARAYRQLEQAGLVSLIKRPGCLTTVTLLLAPPWTPETRPEIQPDAPPRISASSRPRIAQEIAASPCR